MPTFESSPPYQHGSADALGVLVVNLGTPTAPTPAAVRRYLAEFLWDPRVVEIPRPLWWLILNLVILPFRPRKSAEAYEKIWTPQGSPLLLYCEALTAAIERQLSASLHGNVAVELAMSYGEPSIPDALDRLHAAGARRIVVLPLYPQYSGTTTASVFDAVTQTLAKRRWVPELRFINHYHDAAGYIAAVAASIREYREKNGSGELLLFSFHGVPKRTLDLGDPYHCQCQKTARLVAETLGLDDTQWRISFQSRLGRAEWLRPYTDETVEALGASGAERIDVVCPGFAVDCLETLEEIAMQNAESFERVGGRELRYIPALNARDDHAAFLGRLISKHAQGWPEASPDWSDDAAARDRSRERALAMGASR